MLPSDIPKVGNDVDSYCTRCNMDLSHTICAMVGSQIVQVKCNTCGSFHRYRSPKSAPAPKTAPKVTGRAPLAGERRAAEKTGSGRGRASAPSPEDAWTKLVAQAGGSPVTAYRMSDTYTEGNLVQHPKFGLGVVQKVTSPQKANILFRTGIVTLTMGRSD